MKGDRKAQRLLYESNRVLWYTTSMRYSKDKQQADDIFQEGLIRIFNNLKSFDANKAKFSTWSNKVLVSAALRFLKKHNWKISLTELNDGFQTQSDEESPLDSMALKEITALIQELPLGYKLVFNMYAIEGYAHKDIAKELGITISTSKSQLFKARKMLKQVIESRLKVSRYE